jgi:hypothetical protein
MLAALLVSLSALAVVPSTSPTSSADYTVDGLDPDTVVLRTALVGNVWGNDRDPLIAVLADGTVYVATETAAGGYERGRLSESGMEALLDAVEHADLLDVPEYGHVAVTDVGSTVVELTVDGGTAVHDVWALSVPEAGADMLSPEQAAARTSLSGFLDQLDVLVGDPALFAEGVGPFVADRLYLTIDPVPWGDDPHGTSATPTPWPLTTPIEELAFDGGFYADTGCTTLVGTDAAAMQRVFERAPQGPVVLATGTDLPAVPMSVLASASTVVAPRSGCAEAGDDPGAPGALPTTVYLALSGEVELADVVEAAPWKVAAPTDVLVLEAMAAIPAFFDAAGAELGRSMTWTESTWFDVVTFAGDVDGSRNVVVRATCSSYIEDEYDQCELWGRFDVRTGTIVEVVARAGA